MENTGESGLDTVTGDGVLPVVEAPRCGFPDLVSIQHCESTMQQSPIQLVYAFSQCSRCSELL
jgi:hypothetical protein